MDIFYSVKYIKRSTLLVVTLVSLLFTLSINQAFSQSCSGFSPGPITGGNVLDDPGTLCANQSSPLPAKIIVTAGNINDNNDPNNVGFLVLWGDGTNETVFPGDPRISHTAGSHAYKLEATHVFPSSGPNAECEYYPFVYPSIRIAGVMTTCPTLLGQPPRILRWNTDDRASGTLEVSEQATSVNNYLVCEGTETVVTFQDRTTLNCNIPGSELGGVPYNTFEKRWRRYDYGTTNTMTSATGVKVGGVVETYPFRGAVITNTATGGNANAPLPGPTTTLPITVPADALVNQYFEITMRYWNFCNPYSNNGSNIPVNGDFVNGDNPPVSATARITIVTQPLAPSGAPLALNYCNGTAASDITAFTVSGAPANATVNWYQNNSAASPKVIGTKGALITTTTANGSGGATLPITTAFPGFNNTAANNYIVWATYSVVTANANGSTSLTCESLPRAITRSIREALPTPTVSSTSSFPICAGTTAIPLSASPTVASTSTPVGGTWSYTWSLGGGSLGTGLTLNATTGDNITFDIAATANGSKRITVTAAYTSLSNNPTPSRCSTTRDFNFTVNVKPVGGSISGGTSPICLNTSPGALTLSGQTGTVEEWQVDDGSGFTTIASTAGLTTYTPPTINAPGTYIYRVQMGSGVCAKAFSGTRTIIVRDRPSSAVLSGGATICATTSTNLTVTIGSGGQSPYTVVLSDGSSHGSYTSGDNIAVSPIITTTYTITSVTDANGCTVASPTGSATISIGNPISATISGGTTICPATSTDLSIAIVPSATTAAPYRVVYSANGVNQPPIIGYVSGDPITVSPAVNTTYAIVSVTDANLCPATTLSGPTVVNVGATLVDATFSGGGSVCRNATKNLILTINGGVPPYTIEVTPTSGPVISNTNYTSGGNIAIPTSTVGSIDYAITLITDFCGNPLPLANINGNPQTVTVTPVPVGAANTLVSEICSGDNVSVDIFNTSVATAAGGNNVASTYTWSITYPPGLTGGPTSGTGDIGSVTFALNNVTSGQLIADYRVTPTATAGGCAGADFRIKVPVNPKPVASTPKTVAAICSGDNVSVNIFNTSIATAAGGNNVTSTYSWTATYPVNLTGGPAGGTGNIGSVPFTLQNLTGGQLVAVFTVTPTSTPEGCLGSDFVIRVPVNPEPMGATTTSVSAVCSGIPFSINPQTTSVALVAGGNGVASTFTWTAIYDAGITITGGAASGTGNVANTLTNTSGVVLYARYTVTPRSTTTPTLCFGDPFEIIVPISSAADITTQPVNTPVCATGSTSTGTVSFNVVTNSAVSYQWQQKIGAAAFTNLTDGLVPGVATYAGTNTDILTISGVTALLDTYQYRVVLTTTAGSCTLNSNAAVLKVNPLPAAASPTISECSDAPGANTRVVDLTSYNSQVNNGAGLTFIWWQDAAATASPITPGPLGGQDQSYLVSNGDILYARVHDLGTGCDNIGMVTFNINTTPVANAILGPANVCVNTNQVLYQVSNNNALSGAKYSWNIPAGFTIFGGGSGATAGSGAGPFGNDPYVLLVFPSAIDATISVIEKSADNCVGLSNDMAIHVATGPTTQAIGGGTIFCKNKPGVVFSVPQNPTSNYIWTVSSGATIVGPAAGTGLNQIIVDFGNLPSATIDVTENNSSGCPANYPTLTVSLVDSPVMTGPFTGYSICSETQPSAVLDLNTVVSVPSTFTWFVKTISPNVTGAVQFQTGSGPLSHAPPLKNISGTDGSITYTVTPTAISAPGCVGLPADYTVVIKPEPVVNLIADRNVCTGQTVTIPLDPLTGSNVSGALLSWTASANFADVGLSAGSGTGNIGFIAADNQTGSNIVVSVTVTASFNGCTSSTANSKIFSIILKPRPVVDPITNVTVCSGGAISSISFSSNTGGGETYAWTNNNTAIGLPLNGTLNIPGYAAPINTTSASFVGTISVVGTLNGCSGPARIFTITVDPQPVISATLDAAVCSGNPISLNLATNGSSVGAANYNIVSRTISGGVSTVSSATIPAFGVAANYLAADTYQNLTSGALTVAYVVEGVGTINGCTGPQRTITMTINPEPIVSGTLNASVCSDNAINLTLNTTSASVSAASYNIISRTVDPGLTMVTGATVPLAGVADNYLLNDKFKNLTNASLPVVYVVEAKGSIGGCTGAQKTITMMIDPEPVVASGLSTNVCSGQAIGLTLNTAASSVSALNYNIISRTPASAGLTTVSTVTVPANNVAANYLTSDKFQNTTGASINVVYVVEPVGSINGCKGAQTSITMTIDPEPVVASGLDRTVCSGDVVGLTLNTNGTSVAALNYNIISRTPSASLTPVTTATVPASNVSTTYLNGDKFINTTNTSLTVIYVVEPVGSVNGCLGAQKTLTITIDPQPVITSGLDRSVCSGVATGLTLATNGTSVAAANYNITGRTVPGALTIVSSATVPFNGVAAGYLSGDKFKNTTSGSLIVEYVVVPVGAINGCKGNPVTIQVTVDPEPVLISGLDNSICSNQPIGLTLNTAAGSVAASGYNIISRSVASGLSSVSTVTVPASSVADNYLAGEVFQNLTNAALTVDYLVEPVGTINGCRGAQVHVIMTINPEPVIANGLDAAVCSGQVTGLSLNTLSSSVSALNYKIISRTIAPGLTPVTIAAVPANNVAAGYLGADKFTNTTSGALTVEYVVKAVGTIANCEGATKTITITINPQPVMATGLDNSQCSGIATGLVLNTNGTSVPALNYNIISRTSPGLNTVFAATVPQNNVSSIYLSGDKFINTSNGSLPVTYKVRPVGAIAGCVGDELTIVITIDPQPVIASGLDKSVCSSQPIALTLSTIAGGVSASGYNIVNRTISGGLVTLSSMAVPANGVNAAYLTTDRFKNTTTGSLTVTYDIDPVGSINGCIGDRKTITITIDPEPVGQDITEPVCSSGLPFTRDIQTTHITNGINSLFTYTVSSSDPTNVPAEANRTVASNAAISHTYTNATGLAVTITYTITPYNTLHPTCTGTPFVYKRVISSAPVGASGPPKPPQCSDFAFSFDPQVNVNAPLGNGVISTFSWKVSYDGGPQSASVNGVITGNFHNESAAIKNAVYTVTPTAGTCIGTDFTITVPITPEPVMNPTLANPSPICSTNSVSVNGTGVILSTNGTSIAADTYVISLKSQDFGLTGTPTVGTVAAAGGVSNAIQNDTYRNTTATQLKVVYTIIPQRDGCSGDAFDVTVLVNPEPVLNNTGAQVCSTNSLNQNPIGVVLGTNGTSVNASTYAILQIRYSNGGPFSTSLPVNFTRIPSPGVGADLIRNDKYNNTSGVAITVRYTIQGKGPFPSECLSEAVDIDVIIDPEPILSPNTADICSGLPTGLILTNAAGSSAITSYELISVVPATGAIGLTADASNAIPGVYMSGTFLQTDQFYNVSTTDQVMNYTVVPISGLCKGMKQVIAMTVHPAPAFIASMDAKVCSNSISGIVFVDNSISNVPQAVSPFSVAAVNYDIISVTVDAGLTVVTVSSTGLTGTGSGNINTIKNDQFINTTTDPLFVTYKVVPISASGCRGPEKTIVLTVEPKIMVNVPFATTPDLCSGTSVNIVLSSPTNPTPNPNALPDPLITFNYLMTPVTGISGNSSASNVGQGFVITDQLVNNTNSAITVHYKVTAFANSAADGKGCSSDVLDVPITVQPKPKLITTRLVQAVCEGTAIAGVTLNSPTVASGGNGNVIFELISVVDPLTNVVNPTNVAGYSAAGKIYNVGDALNDALTNTSMIPPRVPQTIRYTLRPRFSAGLACAGDDVSIEITINPRPEVTPSATALEICSSESIEVQLPVNTESASTIVRWIASASSVDVVGESSGAGDVLFQTLLNNSSTPQTVTYTITPSFNGCDGTPKILTVRVNPVPKFNSTSSPPVLSSRVTVCDGTVFNLNLMTYSSGATTFRWEVTDVNNLGTANQFDGNGTAINQSFVNNGDASATLIYQITPIFEGTGTLRCEGIPRTITISIAPHITALIDPADAVCEGTPVFLVFELQGQAPFDFVYSATDASGTVNKSITKSGNIKVEKVTPTSTTTYKVLSVKDALGCPVTFTAPEPSQTVTVYQKVTASWTASIPPFVGGNATVGFTNTSTPVDGSVFNYEWSFGTDSYVNPLTSNGVGPFSVNYSRPGDHYVTLVASNRFAPVELGCESTFSAKITIPVLPLMADFKFDPKAACFPQDITITENTATGVAMDWQVKASDGRVAATSTAPLPIFQITSPGVYTISLRTYDPFTHAEAYAPTAGKTFTIYDNPVASFDVRPTLVYVPDTELTTFNFSTGAPEYLWDFGDGSISTEPEPKYTYKIEGIYDITLVAINDHGDGAVCTDTLSRKITAKQGGVTKVPNAFTPSPNGPSGGIAGNNTFNDVFLPIVKGAEEFNMQIFDRWGNLIFESNNSNMGWDGYDKNGKLMPAGVYVYKLTVRLSDGQRSTQIGDITMIR